MGLPEARSRQVLIDGKDVTKVDIKSLRQQISVITQKPFLFEGTLRENLDPSGVRNSDGEMLEVLDKLEFDKDTYLKHKLDMDIEDEGNNLSQGEKQLICFARCALNDTKIAIFDEATASIDIRTEKKIQKAVELFFQDKTMIVIAHRIQTVLDCDKILVMDNGEKAEFDVVEVLTEKEGFLKEVLEC